MIDNQEFHTFRGYEIMENHKKLLSRSMEDYLEMIYRNSLEEGYTRINILADSLNVQAPSVTKMVQKLGRLGLIQYEKYGIVKLSEEGKKIGSFLLNRHKIIEKFLRILGEEEQLLVNVELIEHNVTLSALNKIDMLNNFLESDQELLRKFEKYRNSSQPGKNLKNHNINFK